MRRKVLLWLSLTFNLGLLFVFKYFDFFADNFNDVLAAMGKEQQWEHLELLLPVGISFYTFQTISYSIDVYRGDIKPDKSFLRFATYVSFFPQLVAGPIVRATHFLPQLRSNNPVTQAQVNGGILLVFVGLAKKILIADLLAFYMVDPVFANPANYSAWDLMIALYAYTFQIYCDFSGYSDIAIGIALMLGYSLPVNFNKPYLAQTPSEFWRRWHISLSEWLRDYLYIPLGGGRGGSLLTSRNLLITMLLGGLWHGASWNFILWGLYHAILLIVLRSWIVEKTWNLRRLFKTAALFHLVVFSWLLFRTTDMDNFSEYTLGILDGGGNTTFPLVAYLILIAAFLAHVFPFKQAVLLLDRVPQVWRMTITSPAYLVFFMLFIGASLGGNVFVYFQF